MNLKEMGFIGLQQRFDRAYARAGVTSNMDTLVARPDNIVILVNMNGCEAETVDPKTQVLQMDLNNPKKANGLHCVADLQQRILKLHQDGGRLRGVTVMAETGTDINGVVGAVTGSNINGVWNGNGLKIAFCNPKDYSFSHGYTLVKSGGEIKPWRLTAENVFVQTRKK